jgi:hypothetical protein
MRIANRKFLFSLVVGLMAMTFATTSIMASNMSAINDLGQFYIHEGILYFKGTINGQTYGNYVPLTGDENTTGINSSFIRVVKSVYAINGSYAVIDDRGQLFAYGQGSEVIFGGSPGNDSGYVYLGGSSSDKIDSIMMTNEGAIIKSSDGTLSLRGEHIIDSANSYGSTIQGSVNEEMVILSSTNLARTNDGKVWVGNASDSMINVDAFNGESVVDIGGSTALNGTDQMWALTASGRLLYSSDGMTWSESMTDVSQLFHDSDGNTVAILSDNTYYLSSSDDPLTFTAKNVGTLYGETTNVLVDGETLIIHNGNDFYSIDETNTFSHTLMIAPTYDENGFDNYGIHINTGTEFDSNGLTKDGDAYSLSGYDINGYDENGFNGDGIDSRGFDATGYNTITGTQFDENGLAFDGSSFSSDGYDAQGYDADGYDINNFDQSGLYRDCIVGTTADNFECRFSTDSSSDFYLKTADGESYYQGRDYMGLTAGGLDANGFRTIEPDIGYNEFTNSWFGENQLTYDGQQYYNGYDWQGLDENGYDINGYDINGLDGNLFNASGLWNGTNSYYDETQCSLGVSVTQDGSGFYSGYDCLGYDPQGFDSSGFDANGLDARGFYSTGIHSISGTYFHPEDNLTIDSLEFDPMTNLTVSGSEFGSDTLTYNDSVYGTNDRDYQGYDKNGFLADGIHRNGTIYDDNGFNIDGWSEGGIFKDGMTVKNGELTKQFEMIHSVERDSFFKTLVKTSQINNAGQTVLGDIYVRNNTRDGYELSIDSSEGGILHPSGVSAMQTDGEVDIPYSISLIREGEVGVGIDESLSFSSSDLASAAANRDSLDATGIIGVKILQVAGSTSAASSKTDLKYELSITIVDDSNIMEMAGTYTDTLTLTYRDK